MVTPSRAGAAEPRTAGFRSRRVSYAHSASRDTARKSTVPRSATSSKSIGSSKSTSVKPYFSGSRAIASTAMNWGTYSSVWRGSLRSQ